MPKYNPEQPIGAKAGGLKPYRAWIVQHDGEFEYDSEAVIWARTLEAAENKCRRFLRQWWGKNDMKPCLDSFGNVDPDSFEDIQSGRRVELGTLRELVTLGDLVGCIGEIE